MKLYANFNAKLNALILLILLLGLSVGMGMGLGSAAAADPDANFYVSPTGNDAWSGTLAAPDSAANDGPFATLQRARDAVRDLKTKTKAANIVVLIRGGTYRVDKTIVFGVDDSATDGGTITYAAWPGETPEFSAGQEVKNFAKITDELAGLPASAQGNVFVADVSGNFRALFDDDGLLPRARSASFIPRKSSGRDKLKCPDGFVKDWPNLKDVEVVVRPHHAWILNILPVASVDVRSQTINTTTEATYAISGLHFLKSTKGCWLENALEFLDQPGEWVLDSKKGKLYLWPRGTSPVVAPQLQELIRVEGKVDLDGPQDVPVRGLIFKGLTFQHGERYQLKNSDAGLQHDWDLLDKDNALLRLRGTENCSIDGCHFLHSGSGAIRVDLHGQQNKITGNHIEHMGGGGILLCGYGPGTKDVNKKNLVYNNHVHHVGEIYWHSPGIFLWQSGENRVANNLIHHTPYTSVIVSGCMKDFFFKGGRELTRTIRWNEIGGKLKKIGRSNASIEDVRPFLHTHDNLIEQNEIHHAMEKLGDGNAIYIRGAGAGNIIRRNYIHHLVAPMIMQCAIRTDGGQRDTLIAENIIYKCTSQGIMLKLNTRVENNFVIDVIAPPRGYYLSVREGPLTGATIQRNIFYASKSPDSESEFINELPARGKEKTEDRRGRQLARSADAETDHNLYFFTGNPEEGKLFLAQQQDNGVDTHSVAVDPLFIDPENGNFQFRSDSPALKLGIAPIVLTDIGLRDE